MSVRVFKEVVHADGTIERFEPYPYECGNFMRGDSTRSSEPMVPEPSLASLASWITDRQAKGLPGGVRMESLVTGKKGLHTIRKVVVR